MKKNIFLTLTEMPEREILKQCLDSERLRQKHFEYTNPDGIQDPTYKRIFLTMKDVYHKEGNIDMDKLWMAFPKETRRIDTALCMEITLYG